MYQIIYFTSWHWHPYWHSDNVVRIVAHNFSNNLQFSCMDAWFQTFFLILFSIHACIESPRKLQEMKKHCRNNRVLALLRASVTEHINYFSSFWVSIFQKQMKSESNCWFHSHHALQRTHATSNKFLLLYLDCKWWSCSVMVLVCRRFLCDRIEERKLIVQSQSMQPIFSIWSYQVDFAFQLQLSLTSSFCEMCSSYLFWSSSFVLSLPFRSRIIHIFGDENLTSFA